MTDEIIYCYGGGRAAKRMAGNALTNKCFIKGWLLSDELLRCLLDKANRKYKKRSKYLVASAWINDDMIGIAFIRDNIIMTYVQNKHRRKGIGSGLLEILVERYHLDPAALITYKGTKGSKTFWESNGLTPR